MGSIREMLEGMDKKAGTDYSQLEKAAEDATLQKLALLKLSQDLAEAAAAAEDVAEEEPMPEEGPEEEAIAEALAELVEEADTLGDEEKNVILEAADALEDEEAAMGEKLSTVMDYVALFRALGL